MAAVGERREVIESCRYRHTAAENGLHARFHHDRLLHGALIRVLDAKRPGHGRKEALDIFAF